MPIRSRSCFPAFTGLVFALLIPGSSMSSQSSGGPPAQPARPAAACNAMAFIPTLRLVRGEGADPWRAQALVVRDAADSTVLYAGRVDDATPGGWLLIEQRPIAAESVRDGRRVLVEVTEGGRVARRVPRELALDPTGCHVVLRGEPVVRR